MEKNVIDENKFSPFWVFKIEGKSELEKSDINPDHPDAICISNEEMAKLYNFMTEIIEDHGIDRTLSEAMYLDLIEGRDTVDHARNRIQEDEMEPQKLIPNWNTISTLFDRLSVENVKQAHFEYRLQNEPEYSSVAGLQANIEAQKKIISALKIELEQNLSAAFLRGSYDVLEEQRTFQ